MERTKERSRWAGRLEVVLVMATVWLFGFSTSFIRFGYWTGQILRFCLLAVLPCVVLLPHPFAYMGFTRKRIGKQLLLGLLTALILYPVCLAAEYVFLQPLVPEGYRMTFRLITQGKASAGLRQMRFTFSLAHSRKKSFSAAIFKTASPFSLHLNLPAWSFRPFFSA